MLEEVVMVWKRIDLVADSCFFEEHSLVFVLPACVRDMVARCSVFFRGVLLNALPMIGIKMPMWMSDHDVGMQ